MSKPMIRIHDTATDEVIDREMTDEEYAAFQADLAKEQALITEKEAAEAKRQALLDKLGITQEEAKLLLAQ